MDRNVWNFAEIYAALDRSHGAKRSTDAGTLAERGRRLAQGRRAAHDRGRKAARETVAGSGGALERTLAALEPYLMQIRLERREAMREPSFWWREAGLASALLAPLAVVYGAVARLRLGAPGRRAGVPVVCVGNLTVGGAGKTPTALAVTRLLTPAGERPVFLSRGYGGRLAGPLRVDPARHRAPTSATSRFCWRAWRRPSSRAIASRAPHGGRRRRERHRHG